MSSKNLSKKPKKTWVFLFFWLTSSKSSFKKPKKTLSFFKFFQGHDQKNQKNSRKTKKKPNMSLRPNILWKVLFFWFFGFLEVFWFLVFSRFSQQGAQNLRSRNVRSVFDIGVAIMFFFWSPYIEKKHIPLPAFGIHYFPMQTPFPKICPAIYFKLLPLKTGLFQREVALFLWQPDFFKKRSSL